MDAGDKDFQGNGCVCIYTGDQPPIELFARRGDKGAKTSGFATEDGDECTPDAVHQLCTPFGKIVGSWPSAARCGAVISTFMVLQTDSTNRRCEFSVRM
ncbi:unnamed protein product [Taenia asiatica]|uniref:Uncharacterized protein n=1 Tax=Taenia asiatica TaxID=60517 RepID=A0A0R3WAL2_TAEAS|nr:unnamed protein product [Taenia asiatica]